MSVVELRLLAEWAAAQQARAVARSEEIYKALHPVTKAGVAGAHAANRSMGRDPTAENAVASFAAATAKATGKAAPRLLLWRIRYHACGKGIGSGGACSNFRQSKLLKLYRILTSSYNVLNG